MTTRRKGRECALQILYQADILAKSKDSMDENSKIGGLANVSQANITTAIENFFAHFDAPTQVYEHASSIVHGTQRNLIQIDNVITECSPNWRIDRMSIVDRNVARLATYELLYMPEIPTNVILDEAIEIARRFGTERSSQFVNGVLDAVANKVRHSSNDKRSD